MGMQSLREKLKTRVMAEIDMAKEMDDSQIGQVIDRCILEETKGAYVP